MRLNFKNRTQCYLARSASTPIQKATSDFQLFAGLNLNNSPQPSVNNNVTCNYDEGDIIS